MVPANKRPKLSTMSFSFNSPRDSSDGGGARGGVIGGGGSSNNSSGGGGGVQYQSLREENREHLKHDREVSEACS